MRSGHLNNEHFEHDLDAWNKLNDFDATISVPIPRHDGSVKTQKCCAVSTGLIDLARLKDIAQGAKRIKHDGCIIALDRAPSPDKPGTVRSPGTRRLSHVKNTKARWGAI